MTTLHTPAEAPLPGAPLERAVIFDFDGTLIDTAPFLDLIPRPGHGLDPQGLVKAWDTYHQATAEAQPIEWVLALARSEAAAGRAVVVVTARDERYRPVTATWLDAHPIPHRELCMRPAGDARPDHVVKGEVLAELRTRYEVVMAVDDRPSVVELWRSEDIPTVHVPGWPDHWHTR